MKKTIKAFADVGSHGGIFEFLSGPFGDRHPHLLSIYSEQLTPDLIPVTITYEFPTTQTKGNQQNEKDKRRRGE